MNDDHVRFRDWSAAYSLGALDPADRKAFEVHLASCRRCGADVAAFAPLPGLLAQIDPTELPYSFDTTRADAIEAAAERHLTRLARSRRGWRVAALAAAGAAIVLGVLFVGPIGRDSSPRYTAAVITQTSAGTASIAIGPRPWGTAVSVELTGLPTRTGYEIWLIDDAGGWTSAATWSPTPDGSANLTAATAIESANVERIVVTSRDRNDVLVDATT